MVKLYLQRWEQCSSEGRSRPVIKECIVESSRLEDLLKDGYYVLSAKIEREEGGKLE